MPVDDIPVHEKVRHDNPQASCKNVPRDNAPLCRQIGRQKPVGGWEDLPECDGCDPALRDWPYIIKAQNDIVLEMSRFIKADQRGA